jgi:hypothetical protein
MKAKQSRRLVIDACIARSAGTTDHPISRACREFLRAVLDVCHRAVFSPELSREWKEHRSDFAVRWRAATVARKKIEYLDSVNEHPAMRAEIQKMPRAIEILKDVHLIEAALATDQIIISSDENTARIPFREIAAKVRSIRHIVWVNPTFAEECAMEWLQDGAPPDESRRLTR